MSRKHVDGVQDPSIARIALSVQEPSAASQADIRVSHSPLRWTAASGGREPLIGEVSSSETAQDCVGGPALRLVRPASTLEQGPHLTRSISMQSAQVKVCLQKAAECERRAVSVSDEATRKTYRELARQWRYMAKQVQDL